jgi:di/tricarboxylate transporter
MRISTARAWDDALMTNEIELLEVLVAPRSEVIGKTLKQDKFRSKYGLNVVALWQGDRVYRTDVGDIVLRGGEALLVHGPRAKIDLLRTDPDWVVLRVDGTEAFRPRKMWVALPILAISLVAAALSIWPISIVMFTGALAIVLTGCLTMDEAYQAVEWQAVFLVAGMLPVGIALTNTGAAKMVGDAVISLLGGSGPLAVIGGLFLVAMTFEQFIPGGSAVPAVMAPIAVAAAQSLHSDPRAFALVIAIATGTSTMTPFAHPVNVLVLGPGSYHFRDYVRAGLPLVLITFVVVMVALPIFWSIGGS